MNAKEVNKFFSEARFNPNKPGPMKVIAQADAEYFPQRIIEEANRIMVNRLTPSQKRASLLMIARLASLGTK